MEKLLIVDDEAWIVEGLKVQLDWESIGIELTKTASNGLQAIEIIEKEHPSIIITDIKMPKMDGLELSKFIFEHEIDCSVIVISGFAEFEYAQKAITYNVSDYLTKPIEKDELLKTLDKVKSNLSLKRNIDKKIDLVENEELSNYLSSKYLSSNIPKSTNNDLCYITAILDLSSDVEPIDHLSIQHTIDNYEHKNFHHISFKNHLSSKQFIIIADFDKRLDIKSVLSEFHTYLSDLHANIRENFNIDILIAVSNPYNDLQQSFEAYLESKFIIDNGSFNSDFLIDVKTFNQKNANINIQDEKLEKIITLLEYGTLTSLHNAVHDLFQENLSNSSSILEMRMNIQSLLVKLSSMLKKYDDNLYMLKNSYVDFFKTIWEYNSIYELESHCQELTQEVFKLISDSKTEGNDNIKKIKQYLDIHFCDDITLNSVAKEFYINATYLSRVFKKEIGSNFNDYIKNKRLEKSKYLLKNTNMKIYEIAQAIGYENENYFMKKFREEFGITPTQYKDSTQEINY